MGKGGKGALFVLAALAVDAVLLASLHARVSDDAEGMRVLARWSARYSITWFLLAFLASTIRLLWPGRASAWLVARRRWIGLTFAAAHLVHLGVLVTMALRWPGAFLARARPPALVVGGLAYAFVVAMAATSSDAAVRRLGPRRWRRLHLVGSHVVWAALLLGLLPRVAHSLAWLPAAVGIAALVPLRWWAAHRAGGSAVGRT